MKTILVTGGCGFIGSNFVHYILGKYPNYQVVNLDDLGRFEAGGEVTLDTLRDHGLAKRSLPVKVLGGGELKNGLTVKVQAFSKSAAEAIKGAGGSTEVVAYREAKGD